jgi:hypothetical protein
MLNAPGYATASRLNVVSIHDAKVNVPPFSGRTDGKRPHLSDDGLIDLTTVHNQKRAPTRSQSCA